MAKDVLKLRFLRRLLSCIIWVGPKCATPNFHDNQDFSDTQRGHNIKTSYQKLKKRQGNVSLINSRTPPTLIFHIWLPELWENKIPCFQPPILWWSIKTSTCNKQKRVTLHPPICISFMTHLRCHSWTKSSLWITTRNPTEEQCLTCLHWQVVSCLISFYVSIMPNVTYQVLLVWMIAELELKLSWWALWLLKYDRYPHGTADTYKCSGFNPWSVTH